jgi:hypothetical protein
MSKLKRRLSENEEFEVLKLVLDKFLWFGFGIMAFGLYKALVVSFKSGIWFIVAGAIILLLFAWFVRKEFEFVR